MEKLNEFHESINRCLLLAHEVSNNVIADIHEQGPVIVHQKLCSELVVICQENKGLAPADLPEAMEIINAIKLLERLYPKLNK